MAVLVRSGRGSIPGAAPVARPRPASRSRWPATRRRWSASPPCCRCSARSAWSSTPTSTTPPHDDYVGADRAEALLTSPLGGLDATDVRVPDPRARGPRDRVGARPRPGPARRARPRASSTGLDGEPARRALAPGRAWSPGPGRSSPTAPPSRRCCGRCGTAPTGAARLRARHPGRRPGRPARPPRPRRDLRAVRAGRPGRGAEGPHQRARVPRRPCAPRRSRPTPSPTAASAARRSGCSPPTAPRAWSGGWSWSPTSRRAPGPTCAAATPCSRPTGSAATGCCRR